jgi:hypothetical protein
MRRGGARVYPAHGDAPSLVVLAAEGQFDLSPGVRPAGLDDFALTTGGAADSFFCGAGAESPDPGPEGIDVTDLERWLCDARQPRVDGCGCRSSRSLRRPYGTRRRGP